MYDIALRPIKDNIFAPISRAVPQTITPLHITATAFSTGIISCAFACTGFKYASLVFWALNRALDCLDGAVARHRQQQSDLGGFLDLLGDFIVYALIPIASAWSDHGSCEATTARLVIVAFLEASFWINNFVLFYIAALVERGKNSKANDGKQNAVKELTSVAMQPALIEGFESAAFFTLILAMPSYVGALSSIMFLAVSFSTWQRVRWLSTALLHEERKAD